LKIVFTETFLNSLEESFEFLEFDQGLSRAKQLEIRDRIFKAIDRLESRPMIGAYEVYLSESKYKYRRIIEGYFKIIYRTNADTIFVTDIFDSRQDPSKMKG
jgi:plasmid stabilization system protein ParE